MGWIEPTSTLSCPPLPGSCVSMHYPLQLRNPCQEKVPFSSEAPVWMYESVVLWMILQQSLPIWSLPKTRLVAMNTFPQNLSIYKWSSWWEIETLDTPSPTNEEVLPNSSLTRKCPCFFTYTSPTVKWTLIYKYHLFGCIVVPIVNTEHGLFGLISFKSFTGELK